MRLRQLALLAFLLLPPVDTHAQELKCEPGVGAEISGVVFLLHGLNHEVTTFGDLVSILKPKRRAVCPFRLSGHHTKNKSKHRVTADNWLYEVTIALDEIEARYPNEPKLLLGYSLGAALLVRSLDKKPRENIDKMILLAPAVSIRWSSQLVRLFLPLKYLSFSLPSFSPREYRVHSTTSLDAYSGMIGTLEAVQKLKNKNLLNKIPTKIFINEKDILVSPNGIERWLKRNDLENWEFHFLEPKPINKAHSHIIIDKASLGASTWTELVDQIQKK